MSDDEKKRAQEEQEKKAEEKEKSPEDQAKFSEDGKFVTVPKEVFDSYKNDMHKYKGQRNEERDERSALQKRVDELEAERKKREEDSLLEQEKFKELAEKRQEENVNLIAQLNQQKIDSALQSKAIAEGIQDLDGLKLIDANKVEIDSDTGEIKGVDEAIKDLKDRKSYLFETPAPKVDKGKAGGEIPSEKIEKKDLLKNGGLAMKMKKENPERFKKIMEEGSG